MKKHLLLLLLSAALLGSTRSTAQPYQSIFGKDSTMWSIDNGCIGIGDAPKPYLTNSFSQLKGRNYRKIYFDSFNGTPPTDSFYLREDTISGKVWFYYPPFDTADHLLMDFTLSLGDTFKTDPMVQYFVVDSVYYLNGLKQIRFSASDSYHQVYFKEGIGFTNGLVTSVAVGGCGDKRLCCVKKDTKIVYHSYEPLCYCLQTDNTGTARTIRDEGIKIYPTPTRHSLQIQIPEAFLRQNVIYTIYDQSGRLIKTGTIGQGSISLEGIPSGVYMINVCSKGLNDTQLFTVI